MLTNFLIQETNYRVIQIEGDDLEHCMARATRIYGKNWKVATPAKTKEVGCEKL